MCFDILTLFKPQLPHPEEKPVIRKAEDVSVFALFSMWFILYGVPSDYQTGWRSYDIEVIDDLHLPVPVAPNVVQWMKVPAANYSEIKLLKVDSHYACAGILAHEIGGHGSYSLLTKSDKLLFELKFYEELQKDKLLKLAWDTKPRMRDDIVESHADCYRYLGPEMPESLKRFYPNLF